MENTASQIQQEIEVAFREGLTPTEVTDRLWETHTPAEILEMIGERTVKAYLESRVEKEMEANTT